MFYKASHRLNNHLLMVVGILSLIALLVYLMNYNAPPDGISPDGESIYVTGYLTRKKNLPPIPEEWAKILHFVPENNNQDCQKLFTTPSSRNIAVTDKMYQMRSVIAREMKQMNMGLLTPEHQKLTLTYQELARQDFVHTVCEIGFNIGQSAISWLTTKPDLVLYSFDIGTLPLTKHMGRVLKAAYPDRFTLTIGDSRITVPEWAKHGIKCDIVAIDGNHFYPWTFPDFINMKQIAAKKHIIIADDIYFPDVNKAWKELVAAGYIHHLFDCWIHGLDIDFVIGYYLDYKADTIDLSNL